LDFYPWKRYSDVTNGSRLNIQYATGRPITVTASRAHDRREPPSHEDEPERADRQGPLCHATE